MNTARGYSFIFVTSIIVYIGIRLMHSALYYQNAVDLSLATLGIRVISVDAAAPIPKPQKFPPIVAGLKESLCPGRTWSILTLRVKLYLQLVTLYAYNPAGELFPRVGFIVTNLRWKSSNVVKFYNERGTAEQWIKEGEYALNGTRLSCHDFVDNQVRLELFALVYNLGNFLRRLALPKSVKNWSLRTLRDKLIKIGAKLVSNSRYLIFQMAEVAVPQTLFRKILARIRRLRFLTIPARPR